MASLPYSREFLSRERDWVFTGVSGNAKHEVHFATKRLPSSVVMRASAGSEDELLREISGMEREWEARNPCWYGKVAV